MLIELQSLFLSIDMKLFLPLMFINYDNTIYTFHFEKFTVKSFIEKKKKR